MKVSNNIFDIIILLGAVQGFIICALLFLSKEKVIANKILAAIILLMSLACLNIYLMEVGIQYRSKFWAILSLTVPLVIAMPIGPLVFFYAESLINPAFRFQKKDKRHFYTVILDLVPNLVGTVYVCGALLKIISTKDQSSWGNFIDSYNTYVDIPRWASCSVYLWFSWKKLKSIEFENTENSTQRWAKQFVYVFASFQLIWLIHLIPYEIPVLSDRLLNAVDWYPIYIPLALMVYWLGLNGLLVRRSDSKKATKRLTMSNEVIEDAVQALQHCMEQDRLFLDPSLNLNAVVQHTGISQKIISAVLNQQLGKSFNEFVNEFRVQEVKKKLIQSGNEHLTITGIAFECGFNSQATFQRTFKQLTGLSPTEFLISKKP